VKPPLLPSFFRLAGTGVGGFVLATFFSSLPVAAETINPVYKTNFSESRQNTPAGIVPPTSFGYFFDTNTDNIYLTHLGIPIFEGWADLPGSQTQFPNADQFDVYVWRIDGENQPDLDPCDGSTPYCQVAKATFDQDETHTYTQKDGYYWKPIPKVNLGKSTASDPNIQYATAAVGNFSIESGLPTLVGGTGSFDPAFSWTGNGFNSKTSQYNPDYSSDFPVPWNFVSVPSEANDPLTYYAYFSPNLAYTYAVPAPLPLLGAGAAYGWTRRLRRRIRSARVSALA
jgi:hypothetical protein